MHATIPMTTRSSAKAETHPALSRLRDPRILRELAYIGGRWIDGEAGASFEVRDPASGLIIAHVSRLGAREASRAVDEAARALPAWKSLLPQERSARLRAWHDLILEARTHSLPEFRGCVWRPTGGSLNVFMLTSLLDHPLPSVFGVLPNPEGDELPEIWVQSWERGYRELSLSDLHGQADLNALATDAGTQLAGHFWTTTPEALRSYHRFTQLRAFELTERRARELARSLAQEVTTAWARYRKDLEKN